jgi:oxygen-independent coproporphyrinogen-3 oxidase
MGAFVQAVLRELELHQRTLEIVPKTIYFGGGTPTALSETHLGTLLNGLRERLDCSRLEEFGMEANPKTVGASKARLLRDLGVSRISLGVQAWDEPTLKLLGRDHAPDEATETYDILRAAGIPAVNVDLMFSIPGQTLAVWEEGLRHTIALKSDHVSCYNLTYEEDTEFLNKLKAGLLDTDNDRDADHFLSTMSMLEGAGFEHYEISNYAQSGKRSIHNQSYWRGADYLGLGPSAASTHLRIRWKNIPDTERYISLVKEGRVPVVESEDLDDRAWLIERIALELRTVEGMAQDRVTPSQQGELQMLCEEGLVQVEAGRVRLTKNGKAVSDRIAEMLIPDA